MTTKELNTPDITRTTLAVLFIGILIAASFWILRPFLSAIVWATIIVIATWPLFLKLQQRLWGRRGLAVTFMTVVLLLVIVVPLMVAIIAIAGKADDITAKVKSLAGLTVPPPPDWVGGIPLAGKKLAEKWQDFAGLSNEELSAQITPYAQTAIRWFISQAGSVATVLLQFLLTVIVSAIMYAGGEKASAGVLSFARRLAGPRGEEVAVLAAKAIRSVALGIVVTALIQTAIGGTGLVISGVPGAPVLIAVTFMLCIAQLGPILVMVPAVIWLYWKGDPLWGTVLLIFTIVAGTIDNFIRPVLIKKGADLPLIMIFAGVIGGLVAFGVVGLFIGPVMLAVTYTLLKAWVHGTDTEEPSRIVGE
jgi:predicted PurR-regulated permease PerM